jgi:hypothetical protein
VISFPIEDLTFLACQVDLRLVFYFEMAFLRLLKVLRIYHAGNNEAQQNGYYQDQKLSDFASPAYTW